MNEVRDLAFPEIKIMSGKAKFDHISCIFKGLLISQKHKQKLFSLKIRKPTEMNKNKFKVYNSLYNKIRRRAIQNHYDKSFKSF